MGIPDIPGAEPQFGTDRLQIPFNSNPALPKIFFHILDTGARDLTGPVFCKEFSNLKEIGKLFNPDSFVDSHLSQHLHDCYRAVVPGTTQIAGIAVEAGPDHFRFKHTAVVFEHLFYNLAWAVVRKPGCRTGSGAGPALDTAVQSHGFRGSDTFFCSLCKSFTLRGIEFVYIWHHLIISPSRARLVKVPASPFVFGT